MIKTYKDLRAHTEHDIEPDVDDVGEVFVVCRTCDEILSDESTHGDEAVTALADYYKAVQASVHWPKVKEMFPVEDDEEVTASDG